MYRTWFAIGLAGLLGGVAVVSLFVGFGSPAFLVVAAVSAGGGLLAYRYARERMLRSVYAGIGTAEGGAGADDGTADGPTADGDGTGETTTDRASRSQTGRESGDGHGGGRAAQATDGGETTADYDEWTWADSDPDDPFWSDDPGDWEDPWEWEATDPEEAGADGWWDRREADAGGADGSRRWSGWTGGGQERWTDEDRGGGRRRGPGASGDREGRLTVAEAYETLGLEPGADLEAVQGAYRERVKETHPDLGGDPEAFIRVREAYERVRERLGGEG